MNDAQYLEFAKNIAKEAGNIMLKYFNMDNCASYNIVEEIINVWLE